MRCNDTIYVRNKKFHEKIVGGKVDDELYLMKKLRTQSKNIPVNERKKLEKCVDKLIKKATDDGLIPDGPL